MTVHRREFLAGTAVAALASASQAEAAPSGATSGAALRLSSQLGVIPGKSLEEKLEKMQKWGFDGVEMGGDIVGNVQKYRDAVGATKLKISATCWGSISGALVSEDVAKRKPAADQFKRMLDAAGELKSTGVIYVPAFNGQTKLANQEIRAILLDTLPALGEHAVKAGTRILLEPLNRGEAYFLRQLADAAAICRDCNRDAKTPGVCMMGDFYHMAIEETSPMGAFLSAGKYLHHVHLASKTRVLPGQDRAEDEPRYVDGFRGLKAIGYRDFCSFECGCRGDRDVEIPRSMAFLREQWEKA